MLCYCVEMILFPSLSCVYSWFWGFSKFWKLLFLQVLKGITDDELKILDEFEDVEYDIKAVEVVLTVTKVLIGTTNSLHIWLGFVKTRFSCKPLAALSSAEKLQVETYVWKNKDDPDLYGEWDFEVLNLDICIFLIAYRMWKASIFINSSNVLGMETTWQVRFHNSNQEISGREEIIRSKDKDL